MDWYNANKAAENAPPPPTETEKAWTDYLQADPFYQQTIGQISAMETTDAAERDRRIAQMFQTYGEVPTSYTGPGVTDLVRSLAEQNTAAGTSTKARLLKAYDDAKRNEINQQAARGILGSGETGYQLGELGLQNSQRQFDTLNALLDALGQTNYGYTASETQRALARTQASFEAAQRAAARGVGPLTPGFGQDKGGFVLNPIRGTGNMNQPYQATPGNTSTAPPGTQAVMIGGQTQYVPTPPPADTSFMGYPSYEAWLAAWGHPSTPGSVM